MNIDVNAMGKAFDPEEVYVSLFEVVVPRYVSKHLSGIHEKPAL